MTRSRRRSVASVLLGFALLAAACGGSGHSGNTAGPPPAAGSVSAPASTPRGPLGKKPVSHPTVWLCRPGMASNPCEGNLDATVVAADGSQSVQPFQPAASPKIDCFYVYPTLSRAKSVNAPLAPEPAAIQTARAQVARFASVCRVFAPVYRQLTVNALLTGAYGNQQAQQLASADVDSAWHDYLNNDNAGRGVVLIGHSQGAAQLNRLIRNEVEKDPGERSRIVSAVLPGGDILVPQGSDVGGSFAQLPACRREGQTGCVVSYSSFNTPPPDNALFGRVGVAQVLNPGVNPAGMQVLCTNPAALAGGRGALQPYLPTRKIGGDLTAPPSAALPDLPTAFVTFPGLQAECRDANGASWLQIDATGQSPYDLGAIKQVLGPTWGLHLDDISDAYGSLVDLVGKQAAAWQ